ncbi:DUF1640 domain-containing protein [Allochromatium tepidum]|uniref:DUF1640 domain-containing protein n=1 Tax=Allochromatium tepidum TaxID=553982 RepID=A0ABN6GH87_9GAMM|nr:DUF1640 domain-containing protein [Allochromatium tepidum]BCU07715.1 hypothetical protein Atep_23920 [Allochromatium tepidum]
MSVIELYDKLRTAPDETTRARLIAEAFEAFESRYPHFQELATRTHLSETELRLQKEIELVRSELRKEIEQVRLQTEQVRSELKIELANVKASLLKWSFLFWLTQFSAILLLLFRLQGAA